MKSFRSFSEQEELELDTLFWLKASLTSDILTTETVLWNMWLNFNKNKLFARNNFKTNPSYCKLKKYFSTLKMNWDLITKQVNKGEEVVIISFTDYIDKTDGNLNEELTYMKVVGKC